MESRGPSKGGSVHAHHRSLPRETHSRSRSRSTGAAVSKIPRAWVDLFSPPSSSSPSDLGFTYIPPSIEDVGIFVDYEEDDSCELEDCLKKAIVGYVVRLKPSNKPLKEFITKVWKPKGEFSLHMRVGGFFVCNFSLEEDLQSALGGFWSIRGHPFLLQRWRKDMRLEKAMLWVFSAHGRPSSSPPPLPSPRHFCRPDLATELALTTHGRPSSSPPRSSHRGCPDLVAPVTFHHPHHPRCPRSSSPSPSSTSEYIRRWAMDLLQWETATCGRRICCCGRQSCCCG